MPNGQNEPKKTLSDFMNWVDELRPKKCIFRGLPNKDHSTEASAWRRLTKEQSDNNDIDKLLELNKGLIQDARLRGFDIKDGERLSDLQILAELQHFRVPTFLIDFTYSAQVDLWFACEQSHKDPKHPDKFLDGKVEVIFADPDRFVEVTSEMMQENIDYFFEKKSDGTYPLYQWQPEHINTRIPAQFSVFLFGGDRNIEPDKEYIINPKEKWVILDSIEGFSQTEEETLFPDFDGFVRKRTHGRYFIPEDYNSYRAAGYRAYQKGNYKDAILYFKETINLDSTEADVHFLLGEAYYYLHQYQEVIPVLTKAININNTNINYYKLRGNAYRALDQFEDAKEDFKKEMELAEQTGDIRLIDIIRFKLRETNLQITEGNQWSLDRFKELVPGDIREHYDTRVGNEDLYSLGADLQSLIQKKEWDLELRFSKWYFIFCYGRKRVFGVNLFGNPRLAILGTEEDKLKYSVSKHEPTYYSPHNQWLFPKDTKVDDICKILESVYDDTLRRDKTIVPDGQIMEQLTLEF